MIRHTTESSPFRMWEDLKVAQRKELLGYVLQTSNKNYPSNTFRGFIWLSPGDREFLFNDKTESSFLNCFFFYKRWQC